MSLSCGPSERARRGLPAPKFHTDVYVSSYEGTPLRALTGFGESVGICFDPVERILYVCDHPAHTLVCFDADSGAVLRRWDRNGRAVSAGAQGKEWYPAS